MVSFSVTKMHTLRSLGCYHRRTPQVTFALPVDPSVGPPRTKMDRKVARVCCVVGALLLPLNAADYNASTTYMINGSSASLAFDGHGGLSAGGTSRLLIDYPEKEQSDILDYLFTPNFGASLGVLKIEIGGDAMSTDGSEPSHMHSRDDLSCSRGYEGWLAKEARARNPQIKIWSLSWGVPGWIGGETIGEPDDDYDDWYWTEDNIHYQIQWLKCLRDQYGVQSDFIGIWNERPQGSADYVIQLREALDASDFSHVGITIEADWEPFIKHILTNTTLNTSVAAASAHYPCNATVNSAIARQAHKKFWAGEDTPDDSAGPGGNWSGAGCWGRKLNQHWIKMNSTSSVSWSLLWYWY
jgi:galactosylceramidase